MIKSNPLSKPEVISNHKKARILSLLFLIKQSDSIFCGWQMKSLPFQTSY